MRHFVTLAMLVAVVQARPKDLTTSTTQSPEASFLGLPASADETIERTIDVKFSCANRQLGYYADTGNDCKVFHICNPMELPDGQKAVMQYSFFCPLNTSFDQQALTCSKNVLVPCSLSEKYYHVNDMLGVANDVPAVGFESAKAVAPPTAPAAPTATAAPAAPVMNVHAAAPVATVSTAPVGTIQTFHALQPQPIQHQFQARPQQVTAFHHSAATLQYPVHVVHAVQAGRVAVVPPSSNVVRMG